MANAGGAVRNGSARKRDAAVEDAFATLKHDVGAIGDDVGGLASEIGAKVRHQVKSFSDATSERASSALETAHEQVRARPATALGVAAGAGFVLGLLFAARR